MSTWARTATGDMLLPTIGSGVSALVTDIAQACAIKLADRFQFTLGEWFLDTRQGLPWQQIRGVKNPSLIAVQQIFRRVILGTQPVVDVQELALVYQSAIRNLSYKFSALLSSGETIEGGEGQPFIVRAPAG